MPWPFSIPDFVAKPGKEYPISATLTRTADILGMPVDPTSGFLTQALIVEEIAKRLVALEKLAAPK